jgi:hypothetical protein
VMEEAVKMIAKLPVSYKVLHWIIENRERKSAQLKICRCLLELIRNAAFESLE